MFELLYWRANAQINVSFLVGIDVYDTMDVMHCEKKCFEYYFWWQGYNLGCLRSYKKLLHITVTFVDTH